MKIVSTTLSGNSENIIRDALLSIEPYVDNCILVDTGITDRTIEIAQEAVGNKLVVKKYPWKNNFAEARNQALYFAHSEGANWAITVDTDERIITNGEDLRDIFSHAKANVFMMNAIDNSYCKERAFRLPITEKYVGPTHETYPAYKVGFSTFEKAKFSELPKTAEQYKNKFTRDLEILKKHTSENPKDPRWFYYLGDTLRNLGRLEEAITAYLKCWSLNGWDEESAWSCFKAAECAVAMKQLRRAIEICGFGFARHPGIVELVWLSGWCWYQIGAYDKAEYCSRMAITAGHIEGFGKQVFRIGFKNGFGQCEGPYDLLRWSLMKQNKPLPPDLESKINESAKYRARRDHGSDAVGPSGGGDLPPAQ